MMYLLSRCKKKNVPISSSSTRGAAWVLFKYLPLETASNTSVNPRVAGCNVSRLYLQPSDCRRGRKSDNIIVAAQSLPRSRVECSRVDLLNYLRGQRLCPWGGNFVQYLQLWPAVVEFVSLFLGGGAQNVITLNSFSVTFCVRGGHSTWPGRSLGFKLLCSILQRLVVLIVMWCDLCWMLPMTLPVLGLFHSGWRSWNGNVMW